MRDAARAAAGRWLDELTSVRRAEHCHARQRDRLARSASTCRAVAIVAKPMTAPLCRDTSLSSPTHEERRIRQAGFRSVVPLVSIREVIARLPARKAVAHCETEGPRQEHQGDLFASQSA